MLINVIPSDLDSVVVRDGERNDLDSVKDSSPETPFSQHLWVFDFVERCQM